MAKGKKAASLPVRTIKNRVHIGEHKVLMEHKETTKDSEHSIEETKSIAFHLPVPLDPQEIMLHLEGMKRSPFRQELTKALGVSPTPVSLQAFADKHPDRWAQLVAIFARLSGYTEKVEVSADLTVSARAHKMSDSELLIEAERIKAALALPLKKEDDKAVEED